MPEVKRNKKINWDIELLKRLYWNEEKSCGEIGELLNFDRNTVSCAMRRLGITKRKQSEAVKIAVQKGRHSGIYFSGDKNPYWKGGKSKANSYTKVKFNGHHRTDKKGYVFEHILIWEEVHQKNVPNNYVIHHLNGIKTDNRPSNLIALPKGKHHSEMVNQQLKKRIRELEAECNLYKKALEANQMIFNIGEN